MGAVRGLLVVAVVCSSLATAHAEDLTAAREHDRRGTTLYDLGRFAEAAREYEMAFENKDDPVLLFNIAQAFRFAAEYPRALGDMNHDGRIDFVSGTPYGASVLRQR